MPDMFNIRSFLDTEEFSKTIFLVVNPKKKSLKKFIFK